MTTLKERIIKHENDGCTICLDDMKNATLTSCNHIFCQICIVQWLRANPNHQACPNCRTYISTKDLTTLIPEKKQGNQVAPLPDIDADSIVGRGQAVRFILNEESKMPGKPKMLLFSNDDHAIRKVKEELLAGGVMATTLTGHKSSRRKNLSSFIEGDVSVLLLNTSADGAGLDTLQYVTTSIVFYHDVSQALQKQIIGRAFRMGRDDNMRCNIYHLKRK